MLLVIHNRRHHLDNRETTKIFRKYSFGNPVCDKTLWVIPPPSLQARSDLWGASCWVLLLWHGFWLWKLIAVTLHCKKSWRSSSTPASGDAGPKHTGVEQSFRHPWRKFYYKYRTFPTFFTSVELVRQSMKVSKAACGARTYDLQDYTICHSTTAPHFHFLYMLNTDRH